MSEATAATRPASVSDRYAALEERILDRDQVGASEIYYDLLREGRPLEEMLLEAVRIHGPYTHVPYHERIDDGFVNFVNNDHCLLSARATLNLVKMLPPEAAGLAMAQTIWYIPTGLDIWNQKILKAPGHYARGGKLPPGPPPAPVVHWPDQEPERLEGPLPERLGHWLTLVQRGEVLEAYRVFLGFMEEPEHQREVLAELVFAGLIDVQDRMLYNRSYTTGHKAYRARSTVELGDAIGWDRAHPVLYAGALDMAVGPRWYSTYEMACNAITVYIEEDRISAIPYAGTTERERALVANEEPLTPAETSDLVRKLIREPEPAGVERIAELLRAGKRLRDLLDAIRIGAAQTVIETRNPNNFSMSQHCYQYVSTHGLVHGELHPPAPGEAHLPRRRVRRAYRPPPAPHRRHAAGGDRGTGGGGSARPRRDPRPRGGGQRRARHRGERSVDEGVPGERRGPRRARRAARPRRLPHGERSAQPGDRAGHARGLRARADRRLGTGAHRVRPPHRGPPQVRGLPGSGAALRGGLRRSRPSALSR